MLSRKEYDEARVRAAVMIRAAGIRITEEEARRIEVADFGLGRLRFEGAQILTFFGTERVSAKVIALFPDQTMPEHWHPRVGDDPGKEEAIRAIHGVLRFYLPGPDTLARGFVPAGKEGYYTARHERIMMPGDQLTVEPGTKHWFQAGPEGAVLYSFSTCARDILDLFSDPAVVRMTVVAD